MLRQGLARSSLVALALIWAAMHCEIPSAKEVGEAVSACVLPISASMMAGVFEHLNGSFCG